jgi:protein-S-isoprenylcysteine O-methyltransferase Ste14
LISSRTILVSLGLGVAVLAIAALFIGVGHSLMLLATGGLAETDLSISRGRWDLVVGSILVFLVFLAFIPVRVKGDWRAHGVYGAFIVSLFAEMFGFPLTVFFLSSAFGLSLFEAEFMGYMYTIGMPVGSVITFAGVVLIILGWREVHRSRDQLASGGIYSHVRHPQYLGILLVAGGWVFHWPTIPGLIMFPVLVTLYYGLAKREDRFLEERFGDAFREYANRTPMFLPALN